MRPTDVSELKDMFHGPQLGVYRKISGTQIRLPTYAEIAKAEDLVTFVADESETWNTTEEKASFTEETRNRISKEHVIARNPEVIGRDEKGRDVFNEWLIPKKEFFKKYSVGEADLKSEFRFFEKKMPLRAIEITERVNILIFYAVSSAWNEWNYSG